MFSSQAHPYHLISSDSPIPGSDHFIADLSLTHLEPMRTEKLLSVLDNSNVSVSKNMCSDASVDECLCSNASNVSDGDVALQRDIQRIIQEHIGNVIKKWGNSE